MGGPSSLYVSQPALRLHGTRFACVLPSWVVPTVEARVFFPFYGLPASRLLLTLGWWRGTFPLRSLRMASGPKTAFRLALERAILPYLVFYWAVGSEV